MTSVLLVFAYTTRVVLPFLELRLDFKNMSVHNSLKKGSSSLGAKRSVLKRQERIELLAKRKEWKEGDRVFNLKKTKFVV